MARKRKHNYVDNEKLYDAMVEHIDRYNKAVDAGLEPPGVSNYIGEVIYLISENLAKRPNFSGYSYIDEMKSDGRETCLMYLHNFNYEKYNNPFSYFTQIMFFAFVRRIQKEEKQQYIKYKSMIQYSIDEGLPLGLVPEDEDTFNNRYSQLVEKYEKKPKEKKAKAKKEAANKKGIEKFISDE